MRLGAIFAGGQARRFGSDKAAAVVGGVPLIERVMQALLPQVDELVVVGRAWPGLAEVADVPAPGLGPLGALAGALAYAQAHGFAEVLTSGCDLPDLPRGLVEVLAPAPAVVAGQPLVGLWPATLAADLTRHLNKGRDRAMHAWISASGARKVALARPLANINTPADLAAFKLP